MLNESEDLRSRYYTLLTDDLNVSMEVADEEWSVLQLYYTEAHRQYHNLHHLFELCQYFDTYRNLIQDHRVVLLSIFYHDLVYDPMSKTNEEDSAEVFLTHFATHLPADILSKTQQYIIETKKHDVTSSTDEDLKLFIDFDLAILGSDPARYEEYTAQIRGEYSAYDDKSFTTGRLCALQELISADGAIYASKTVKTLLEERAKHNMREEICRLRAQLESLNADIIV